MSADDRWQVWYQDVFDRDCPRQVEATGFGDHSGCVALWRHHLRDGVDAGGRATLSRYNLWLGGESLELPAGDPYARGLAHLHAWTRAGADDAALDQLAMLHLALAAELDAGAAAERIAAVAADCAGLDELVAEAVATPH